MKNTTVDVSRMAPAPLRVRLDERPERYDRPSTLKETPDVIVPEGARLAGLLGLDEVDAIDAVLHRALLEPIAELTANRGKRIRSQLVSFSYRLTNAKAAHSIAVAKRCRIAAEAVEFIHAGSLIVDDIEDGSPMRRGRPALHVRHGLPIALNAGNWLYFWPFELLKEMGVTKDQLRLIYERCHRTLLRAHFGQAIDLGTKVDTLACADVAAVCIASMRLKTGALMGFAAMLGAAIAESSEKLLSIVDDFGRDLGVALQMFDDLGNVIGKCEPSKRYEDLTLSRPSWVWACAANHSSARDYREFLAAVRRLPDATHLELWVEKHHLVDETRKSARAYLDRAFDTLENRLNAAEAIWSKRAFQELRDLGEEIAVAYG
jgi:geranylgeranyl pyrophosphate synthase